MGTRTDYGMSFSVYYVIRSLAKSLLLLLISVREEEGFSISNIKGGISGNHHCQVSLE